MSIKLRNIDPVVLLGKVGVGVESPSSKLHISDVSSSSFIKLTNTSTSRTNSIGVDANGLLFDIGNQADSIDFRSAGNSLLKLDGNTGNLRLGGHNKVATSLLHLYAAANGPTDNPMLTLEGDADGSPRLQFKQNEVNKGYIEWDHSTQSLTLNPGSGYIYASDRMGVNTAPSGTDVLKVGGRLNVIGGIYSGTTEILDVANKIDYALLKNAPSWIDATQGNVTLSSFGGNLPWTRLDSKPSWIEDSASSINLSSFNNDLGASSQWSDDTTGTQGIYYNKHVKVSVPSEVINAVDDSAVLSSVSKGDGLAALRLTGAGSGGSSWNFICTETEHSGGGGKLAVVAGSVDETNASVLITSDGKLAVNTSAATSLFEKFTVYGDAAVYDGSFYLSHSGDHQVFINSSSTESTYLDWWYTYRSGASGTSPNQAGEKLKYFYIDQDGFVLHPTWSSSSSRGAGNWTNKTGIAAVVNGTGSSASSGFNLEVVGAIRCTSLTQTSDQSKKRDITDSDLGLSFINNLRPVKYFWKDETREFVKKDGQVNTVNLEYSRPHYGLLAQQVKTVMDQMGIDDFGAYKDSSVKNPERAADYGLDYNQFIAPIVKAIQELSEKVENLENS